jgi:hypothetical protein
MIGMTVKHDVSYDHHAGIRILNLVENAVIKAELFICFGQTKRKKPVMVTGLSGLHAFRFRIAGKAFLTSTIKLILLSSSTYHAGGCSFTVAIPGGPPG